MYREGNYANLPALPEVTSTYFTVVKLAGRQENFSPLLNFLSWQESFSSFLKPAGRKFFVFCSTVFGSCQPAGFYPTGRQEFFNYFLNHFRVMLASRNFLVFSSTFLGQASRQEFFSFFLNFFRVMLADKNFLVILSTFWVRRETLVIFAYFWWIVYIHI